MSCLVSSAGFFRGNKPLAAWSSPDRKLQSTSMAYNPNMPLVRRDNGQGEVIRTVYMAKVVSPAPDVK